MPYYGGNPMRADPKALMERLMRNGMSRMQAAAIVGNLQRESGLVSNNMNREEGAYGLMQWRGPRFEQLQKFATEHGQPWTDPMVQMDFISHEMSGTEKRSVGGFRNARSIDEASAALKPYIRYSSDPKLGGATERMMFARNYYGAPDNPAPSSAPAALPQTPQPAVARPAVDLSVSRETSVPARGRGLRTGIASLGDLGAAAYEQSQLPYEQRSPGGRAISDWLGRGQATSGDNPRQVASNLPSDIPGTQAYTEPATGNRMVTGGPGRYQQGDLLNSGQQPASALPLGQDPPRFPGGIVPQPRARPFISDQLPATTSVAELGSLVDPTRYDYYG